jgi:glycosyltransferase involved in cell wall biosynthesis
MTGPDGRPSVSAGESQTAAGPQVSVVVITKDRREELDRTLTTLVDLPDRPPIIVVDNGSTDGTPDLVRSRHATVRLVEMGRNLGVAARNVGVALAASPFGPSATTTPGGRRDR